ncbi:Hypothetical predicted protein [Mytilus galloprovincialis]|uniref:DUF4371 domain-containing protein n=1 Tax=Mytilus galloprovincialis TaxID=29158 RepID=A0A8B6GZW4_MYTGA|nr:Hypothetical predicted protein [Mytilus galloprovincialis]
MDFIKLGPRKYIWNSHLYTCTPNIKITILQKAPDPEHESDQSDEPVDKCPRLEKEVSSNHLEVSPSDVIKDSTETVCLTSTPASINISSRLEMFPGKRFHQPETFSDHLKTTQHQNAITTEMYQRVSCFQKQLDKQDNVADEILYKAFEAVYLVMKEEIANLKIKSLLNLLERLGIEDMKYFQHRSQAALREIFIAIGGTLEDKLVKEVQQAEHYGLMVDIDDVSDISVMEQMVTFIQFYSKTECKVKTAFLSIDNLLEESDSANSTTITDRIIKNIEEYGLKKDKLCSFVSDGASVMVAVDPV